jgi:hypothetical protein
VNVDKEGSTITVRVDGSSIEYDKDRYTDVEAYFGEENLWRMEEWKIDLVKNHGVDPHDL